MSTWSDCAGNKTINEAFRHTDRQQSDIRRHKPDQRLNCQTPAS
ncbi:hypothetical protein RISK_000955 [Rhodopirellula islandica]|uniref:Uncharacterized protein n=1 Tax=Rhodopirellula islandica TaxID=595434 RepID=A0A0J1ENT3_RHOIS|nr:hypothetical protein RISK_000955 [Rhodopirellula islandica]